MLYFVVIVLFLRQPRPILKTLTINFFLRVFLKLNFDFADSQSFARLQEALRESKRQVDKQRERIMALETSRKQMENDLSELQE